MSDVLKLQHIATKNQLLGALKSRFDYDELVRIGHTIGLLESVKFEDAKSEQAEAELSALRARLERADVIESAFFSIVSPEGFYQMGIYEECPECENSETEGHKPDCKLARLLGSKPENNQ